MFCQTLQQTHFLPDAYHLMRVSGWGRKPLAKGLVEICQISKEINEFGGLVFGGVRPPDKYDAKQTFFFLYSAKFQSDI